MKKYFYFIGFLIIFTFLFSCKGEKGDRGPTGPAGTNGDSLICVSFQDGLSPYSSYDRTRDTMLISGMYSKTNVGSCYQVTIGTWSNRIYRGILKFDLTSMVPENVIAKKAYLTVYCVGNNNSATITAYSVT